MINNTRLIRTTRFWKIEKFKFILNFFFNYLLNDILIKKRFAAKYSKICVISTSNAKKFFNKGLFIGKLEFRINFNNEE